MGLDDDLMAVDLIRGVGHQGQFLGEEHTRTHHRTEFSPLQLPDRGTYAAWKRGGGTDVVGRAHERAQQVLRDHQPAPLAPEVVAELQAILDNANRTLID
jgi:trimethylamine--corrinoid protein Co-methyltransferase